jgi:hypothetical protein
MSLLLDSAAAAPYTAIVFGTATRLASTTGSGLRKGRDRARMAGRRQRHRYRARCDGAIASGAFVVQSFLDPSTEHFEKDASGTIQVGDPAVKIPVTIVVPKAAAPASGYPVIVNGHGLSNNRGSMLAVANEFARAGFVTIGIDDVLHGARLGLVDEKNNAKGTYATRRHPGRDELALGVLAGLSDFQVIAITCARPFRSGEPGPAGEEPGTRPHGARYGRGRPGAKPIRIANNGTADCRDHRA